MPKRSHVDTLPAKVREQLEQLLLASGFSGYRELETWCKAQGIEISKSSLHRFGASFEERVKAIRVSTEQARAVVAASPDDDNALNEALIRLVQERVFSLLVEANTNELPAAVLAKVTKAIADVGRASVQQKKYQTEVRAKAQEAAEEITRAAAKGGLSDATVEQIRRRILGIAE
jgi:hypothetical protein